MNKFSKPVCIAILACLLSIGILHAKAPNGSAKLKPQILVEALLVEVTAEISENLGLSDYLPNKKVTIPVAKLLWLLADPNSAKVLTSAKLKIPNGQTDKVSTGQKLKFLIKKDDGSLEHKTTDTPVGTTLEATPIIDQDGDIILNFKFEHSSIIEPPREVDPQTFLPIGPPMTGITETKARVKLKSGEPMIAGGTVGPAAQRFILVRAEILQE